MQRILLLAGCLALGLTALPGAAAAPLCDPVGGWYCVEPGPTDPEGNACAASVTTYLVDHYVACLGAEESCLYSFTDPQRPDPPLFAYGCAKVLQEGCTVGVHLYDGHPLYPCV